MNPTVYDAQPGTRDVVGGTRHSGLAAPAPEAPAPEVLRASDGRFLPGTAHPPRSESRDLTPGGLPRARGVSLGTADGRAYVSAAEDLVARLQLTVRPIPQGLRSALRDAALATLEVDRLSRDVAEARARGDAKEAREAGRALYNAREMLLRLEARLEALANRAPRTTSHVPTPEELARG